MHALDLLLKVQNEGEIRSADLELYVKMIFFLGLAVRMESTNVMMSI